LLKKRTQPFVSFPEVVTGETKVRLFLPSDIFTFPPYNAGQPLTVLEAVTARLPIITADIGAIKETVINAEKGNNYQKAKCRMEVRYQG